FAVRLSSPDTVGARSLLSLENLIDDQMRFLDVSEKEVGFIVLSNAEFDELKPLVWNKNKREVYLADINPETTANKAYYSILQAGARQGASDVHVEPFKDGYRIRYRINGRMQAHSSLNPVVGRELVNIIKLAGKLDLAEHRRPQDGGITFNPDEVSENTLLERLTMRVSTTQTQPSGLEKVVMRFLQSAEVGQFRLKNLSFPTEIVQALEAEIETPKGAILVTGPTGSGKTTTLYSILSELNKEDVNILTVEDPVEMFFPGITQTAVQPKAGITFATQLRSFLRQDPDIILVGEIRDQETAEIAMKAANTGHFVLSTLHTNSSFSAILRLYSLGISGAEIQDSIRAIMSQRLVRECCASCSSTYDGHERLNKILELDKSESFTDPIMLRQRGSEDDSAGCQDCLGTGYSGRIVVPELWQLGEEERELIYRQNTSSNDFLELAIKRGMSPLWKSGLSLVLQGKTTLEELIAQVATRTELAKHKQYLRPLVAEQLE
ncbi:MAG: type II/IV secretion system protein, partial [Bdellovibrionales bacterium]|nr:type II/IV secretion system protein [Bdellovibrionales bacterium]